MGKIEKLNVVGGRPRWVNGHNWDRWVNVPAIDEAIGVVARIPGKEDAYMYSNN